MEISFEEFEKRLSKLPRDKRQELVQVLFEMAYEGTDDKILRMIASSVKFARENKIEGHEKVVIPDKDLEKMTHIQDGNRLLQKKKS